MPGDGGMSAGPDGGSLRDVKGFGPQLLVLLEEVCGLQRGPPVTGGVQLSPGLASGDVSPEQQVVHRAGTGCQHRGQSRPLLRVGLVTGDEGPQPGGGSDRDWSAHRHAKVTTAYAKFHSREPRPALSQSIKTQRSPSRMRFHGARS